MSAARSVRREVLVADGEYNGEFELVGIWFRVYTLLKRAIC